MRARANSTQYGKCISHQLISQILVSAGCFCEITYAVESTVYACSSPAASVPVPFRTCEIQRVDVVTCIKVFRAAQLTDKSLQIFGAHPLPYGVLLVRSF